MKKTKTELRKEYDLASRQEVIDRDRSKCVICYAPAHDVHEIIPRSAFGYDKSELLFEPKNRVCLCRNHHSLAHNYDMRCKLLKMLKDKYNYNYSETEFQKYLGEVD